MMQIGPTSIAITGASGFIGTRVVEYLALSTPATVSVCVRSFSALRRIAELPQARLQFVRADLLDAESLERAFNGCQVVVHCGYGSHGDASEQWDVTVHGTANALAAARAVGTRRFVHLSSAAVREFSPRPGVIDEPTPVLAEPEAGSYEAAKLQAERLVLTARDLDPLVLQPTVVYGPWGKDWTLRPLERLRAGVRGLPTGTGTGVSNAVFVDDAARAVVAACASGSWASPLLVAHPERVTWGEFYDAFRVLAAECEDVNPSVEAVEQWEVELYANNAVVDAARAQEVLDWGPVVGFEEGMIRVAAWAQWHTRGT